VISTAGIAVIFVVVFIIVVGVALGYSSWRSRRRQRREQAGLPPSQEPDRPESRSARDLLPRLTEEVRQWQAEAAYWKQTAQRLQRELDQRDA
jgi:flagellar biosynthesis/type III secretory pathway M-ring protein FliF/YscJ